MMRDRHHADLFVTDVRHPAGNGRSVALRTTFTCNEIRRPVPVPEFFGHYL